MFSFHQTVHPKINIAWTNSDTYLHYRAPEVSEQTQTSQWHDSNNYKLSQEKNEFFFSDDLCSMYKQASSDMHRSIFMQVPDFSSVSRIIQNQQKKILRWGSVLKVQVLKKRKKWISNKSSNCNEKKIMNTPSTPSSIKNNVSLWQIFRWQKLSRKAIPASQFSFTFLKLGTSDESKMRQ